MARLNAARRAQRAVSALSLPVEGCVKMHLFHQRLSLELGEFRAPGTRGSNIGFQSCLNATIGSRLAAFLAGI